MIGEMTLARPYALAAFEYAQAQKALPAWGSFLAAASDIAEDNAVRCLMARPEVTIAQLSEFFCDILKPILDQHKRNFIFLISEHKRLSLLPEVAALFKSYREAIEKILSVNVMSAIELNQTMKEKLIKALEKKLNQHVTLECEVNPALVGGMIVRAEDRVMDGSIQGQLKRLLSTLSG